MPKQKKATRVDELLLVVSFFTYACAFFLPAAIYDFSTATTPTGAPDPFGQSLGREVINGDEAYGKPIALLVGHDGMSAGDLKSQVEMILIWSANPLLWLSWLWLLMNRPRGALIASILCFAFASLAFLFQLAPEYGSGYFLWLASFAAALVAGIVSVRSKRPSATVPYLVKRMCQVFGLITLIFTLGLFALTGQAFAAKDTFWIYILMVTVSAASLVWIVAWTTAACSPHCAKSKPAASEPDSSAKELG